MDDRVVAADDRERVAGVGQVGLDVVRGGVAAFVHRGHESHPVTSWPAAISSWIVAAPTLP